MRDQVIDTFSIELPWDICAAKVARIALSDWGANPECDVAVSELVLNAFQHGAPPITLTAIRTPNRVRIEISDGRSDFGPRRKYGVAGLKIVDAFSTAWGTIELPTGGKVVWVEFPA
ncbi:MAG TPA: ATP-binding protein [Acidimicrobiia bacterium]|jgi:hypothetical protein|nr:ATP-binding protein [Acidimicrobiia bacterium]